MQPDRGQPGPVSPGYFRSLLSSCFIVWSIVLFSLELQVSNFSNSFPMTPRTISKILHALGEQKQYVWSLQLVLWGSLVERSLTQCSVEEIIALQLPNILQDCLSKLESKAGD